MAFVYNRFSSIHTLFAAKELSNLANVPNTATGAAELLPVRASTAPVVAAEYIDGSVGVCLVHASPAAALGMAFCGVRAGGKSNEGNGDGGEEMHVEDRRLCMLD